MTCTNWGFSDRRACTSVATLAESLQGMAQHPSPWQAACGCRACAMIDGGLPTELLRSCGRDSAVVPWCVKPSRWMSLLRDAWIQAPSMEIVVPEASNGSWKPSRNAGVLTYAKKSVSEIRMCSEYRTWLVQLSE